MSLDLQNFNRIGSGLFCRIDCDYYKTAPDAEPITQILTFSDYIRPIIIEGQTYAGIGKLLTITKSGSELRNSGQQITLSISGIPNTSIYEIVNSKIKGSSIKIYRVLFNPVNGQVLNISGNPIGRFFGIVDNFSLVESFNIEGRTSTNTITLTCSSAVDVLGNKIAGRRTNPVDQKRFYPDDLSMDRVPNLVGANFNFGAPKV